MQSYGNAKSLEGKVISVDMASMSVLHLCTRCSSSEELESGFYCYTSCHMMGTMESATTSKPKVTFCFLDKNKLQNELYCEAVTIENFTGHAVLNKIKLATHLCKMPAIIIHVDSNNFVTAMEQNHLITEVINTRVL